MSLFKEQGQKVVYQTYGNPRVKECPKKGRTFTFKPTSSSDEKYEHFGIDGHDIDH